MEPSTPIFVVDADGGDVAAFPDVRAAEGFMEVPEAQANAYVVFDSAGRAGDLAIEGFDVKLRSWSAEPRHTDFRRVLERYLLEHGHPSTDQLEVHELMIMAYQVARDQELARTRPRIVVPLIRWLRARSDGQGV